MNSKVDSLEMNLAALNRAYLEQIRNLK